jgi:hypothetical protein
MQKMYRGYVLIEVETGDRFNFYEYRTYDEARKVGDRLGKRFSYTLLVYGINIDGSFALLDTQ